MTDYSETKKKNRRALEDYTLNPSDGTVSFFPVYIQLEQTNRCNASCIMCNHFYLGNKGFNDISDGIIEKLRPIFPYCETIMLNGDGEPFLCESIERNIEIFSEFGIRIGTNTNLCYVPENVWSYFSSDFEFLNISCDAATAETFEMIRRGLSFDKFTENLGSLSEIAPDLKRNFDCVVMKQNIGELPGIVNLAKEYGIKEVRFRRLGVNPLIANESDQPEYYYDYLDEMLAEACSLAEEYGISVSFPDYKRFSEQLRIPPYSDLVEEIENRQHDSRQKSAQYGLCLNNDYFSEKVTICDFSENLWSIGRPCKWAVERCYIDINGNVSTCCYNIKKNMGSLSDKSFDEIWNGDEYIALRKIMATGCLPDFCRQCNWIKESKF